MTNIQFYLLEIKLRSVYLILSTIITFVISYNCQLELIYIIGKPFIEVQQSFVFLELTEAFYTLLHISTLITLFVTFPFFCYHIWSFYIPSFYKVERNQIIFVCILFFSLVIIEILVIYFFLLPKICNFLLSFEITSENKNSGFDIKPLISVEFTARIESYVKLIIQFFTITLFLFQIPFCVCFLYYTKIVDVSILYSNRQFLSIISLLLSAFIVPPDVLTQFIVAFFIFFIFEVLIFIGLFFE